MVPTFEEVFTHIFHHSSNATQALWSETTLDTSVMILCLLCLPLIDIPDMDEVTTEVENNILTTHTATRLTILVINATSHMVALHCFCGSVPWSSLDQDSNYKLSISETSPRPQGVILGQWIWRSSPSDSSSQINLHYFCCQNQHIFA